MHFLHYFSYFYLLLGCCCCGGSVFYIINRPFAEWLAIHVVQNRRAGEQKSQWDKTKKGIHNFKRAIRVPVRLLLSSMTVLYNVNDYLQKSYFGILSDTHVRSGVPRRWLIETLGDVMFLGHMGFSWPEKRVGTEPPSPRTANENQYNLLT